ncbi:putative ferric-chelate reductase (NADH) [Helianthus annuus]|uniref:ferric-chelate reductase (NADH) n=1 Tax=Helianthus annuus TaxID=4232 RepID=A0A251UI32_HELAN|nr:ferric reduction oxidase 2 [Helianthus annuus]KAF5801422.1 putative ferric-chelate reductase (NADH) [Helianthus annuus]KAJ0559726.1 putative ferric-chelate reductase (NADH) [Helianthus annuus]KAJ0565807.1 putative ferric-chelate reductase (NADH) [Helianthus annuus]KAJ0572709.1 putative ferric-chelate reductase (NADH) [Helianthus annuus]
MKIIQGLAITIFMGYLVLWIVTPTSVYYNKWLVRETAHTTSTYFEAQGSMMLLYTCPILLMAIMGSVYNHLRKRASQNRNEGDKKATQDNWNIWRRPMIIKGLGIVSKIELAFFVMFIALIVWSFTSYLHVGFAYITPAIAAEYGEKVWEMKLDTVALRFGLVGNLCLAFLFFPVTRGSTILSLFGLTSEASIKYHIWLGHIVMTIFTAHGVCYIIYWIIMKQTSEMMKWAKTEISNVAGELSLIAGLIMWATTFPRIRRKMFEVFFYTHHLYILFVVFYVFHVGIAYASTILPGFYLFMIDRFLRFLQSRGNVRLVSARVLPCETLELNFSKSKGLEYTPTSIIFINVPSISKAQWHPFTVTSSSNLEPEKLSVMIKSEGSWSRKLYQLLSSPNSIDRLDVCVEGPYGPISTNFLRHDMLVMVSGGSGITPFISIFRELVYTTETLKCKAPKILLISAFKDSSDLTMLELLLPSSGAPIEFTKIELQIEAYVTREKQPVINDKKVSTIWLKPKPSDAPITPVLGKNGWLWLGALISSSFVVFLLFMGFVTRFYIYPIDKNTNEVYSMGSRAAINMLLICVSIMVTCYMGFWWNKKRNAIDSNQIQNMEGATPTSTPNSWFYNADRELESVPQEPLFQSTNVHFGERPDLKRILFEQKASSVGVLVCGPKKMRHEVANICSSGLASNLHFESISFSW